MLIIVILSCPLRLLWHELFIGHKILDITQTIMTVIVNIFIYIACVMLGVHRMRALVCALFIFCISYILDVPVVFFIAAAVKMLLNAQDALAEIIRVPVLYYGVFFFNGLIIMGSCFLAAHWLRKTKEAPPVKTTFLFCLFYLIFAVIVQLWMKDIMTLPISFTTNAVLGIFLIALPLVIFYLYTRLIACKTYKEKETDNTQNSEPDYTRFIQHLSKRELEVIKAVLSGFVRYKDIAESLHISVNTVKTHLKNIYQTTGVSNITALTVLFHGYS